MAIVDNDTGEYSEGAASVLRPPISAGDCAQYDDFEELVTALEVADSGCTIRSGVAYAVKTTTEIAVICTV